MPQSRARPPTCPRRRRAATTSGALLSSVGFGHGATATATPSRKRPQAVESPGVEPGEAAQQRRSPKQRCYPSLRRTPRCADPQALGSGPLHAVAGHLRQRNERGRCASGRLRDTHRPDPVTSCGCRWPRPRSARCAVARRVTRGPLRRAEPHLSAAPSFTANVSETTATVPSQSAGVEPVPMSCPRYSASALRDRAVVVGAGGAIDRQRRATVTCGAAFPSPSGHPGVGEVRNDRRPATTTTRNAIST